METQKVVLNVGGTKFETYLSTLINKSLYFTELFIFDKYKLFDENGTQTKEIFIDRDPNDFKVILRYMRGIICEIPEDFSHDKTYYGIDMICDNKDCFNPKMHETNTDNHSNYHDFYCRNSDRWCIDHCYSCSKKNDK